MEKHMISERNWPSSYGKLEDHLIARVCSRSRSSTYITQLYKTASICHKQASSKFHTFTNSNWNKIFQLWFPLFQKIGNLLIRRLFRWIFRREIQNAEAGSENPRWAENDTRYDPRVFRALNFFHFLESSSKAPRFHRSTIEKSKRRWIWAARVLDYWNQMNQITLWFLIDWSENNCFFRESSSCSFRTVIVNDYKKRGIRKGQESWRKWNPQVCDCFDFLFRVGYLQTPEHLWAVEIARCLCSCRSQRKQRINF